MANIAHASLSGAELHEPKGIAAATVGQVYVANGSSSGAWTSIDATAFTGMIADFTTPLAPSGWLELDGSVISTTTYATLYSVMSIQQNGTRTSGSAIVTSLPSTTGIKAGYYVFGTGIATGTTVLSVDSSTQITMSGTASSSGTNTVIVSPWLLNTGTIKLPDLVSAGRYRRSRTSGQAVGQLQADQLASHLHALSLNTGTESATHTHNININTGTDSVIHTHQYTTAATNTATAVVTNGVPSSIFWSGTATANTVSESVDHSHNVNGVSGNQNSNHTHLVSGNTNSTGSSETRPISMVFITCVKT